MTTLNELYNELKTPKNEAIYDRLTDRVPALALVPEEDIYVGMHNESEGFREHMGELLAGILQVNGTEGVVTIDCQTDETVNKLMEILSEEDCFDLSVNEKRITIKYELEELGDEKDLPFNISFHKVASALILSCFEVLDVTTNWS